MAQQAVARLAEALQIEGLQEFVEPEQHRQIDLPRGVFPAGQSLVPTPQPVLPESGAAGGIQPLQDRRQQLSGPREQGHGLQVEVQIFGAGCSDADRVNAGGAEAEEIVEHDRVERRAQLAQPLRGRVEVATLVGGADHEHAHVVGGGGLDGGLVLLLDVIPVQVEIIEAVGVDRLQDHGQRRMGGEADRTDAALLPPALSHRQAAVGPQGLLEQLGGVHSVDGEQVEAIAVGIEAQPREAGGQFGLEDGRVRVGRHLALEDPPRIGQVLEEGSQLPLGAAVVAGGLDVVEAGADCLLQQAAQVDLAGLLDGAGFEILPALLKAHAAEGENRHRQTGAAETPAGHHPRAGVGGGTGSWVHEGVPGAGEATVARGTVARGNVRRRRMGLGSPRGRISCCCSWASRAGTSS